MLLAVSEHFKCCIALVHCCPWKKKKIPTGKQTLMRCVNFYSKLEAPTSTDEYFAYFMVDLAYLWLYMKLCRCDHWDYNKNSVRCTNYKPSHINIYPVYSMLSEILHHFLKWVYGNYGTNKLDGCLSPLPLDISTQMGRATSTQESPPASLLNGELC